jgi:TRAP-type C4-dicarboxylate transport system permease small subunit
MDQVLKDARRLASIGTFFIVIGWLAVIYALVAGTIWWIDLASREAFNVFEAFAVSASAVGGPVFVAFVLAGFGYALRLFALYVASKSQ